MYNNSLFSTADPFKKKLQTAYQVPTAPVSPQMSRNATPVQQLADGRTRYSDGSIKGQVKQPAPPPAPKPEPPPAPRPQPQPDAQDSASSNLEKFYADQARQDEELTNRLFARKKERLESQIPTNQALFDQFQANTEGQIADTQKSAQLKKENADTEWGEGQRQLAQSRAEAEGRTRNRFAALNTTDSFGAGSYQSAQNALESGFQRSTAEGLRQRGATKAQIDAEVLAFEKEARNSIVNESLKLKQTIALIQNDINASEDEKQAAIQRAYAGAQENILKTRSALAEAKAKQAQADREFEQKMALEGAKNGGTVAEEKLRSEFFQRVKQTNYPEVVSQYQKIVSAPDNAAGDMGMIFAYMKLLDPTSTVREGEYANAQNATGVPQQVLNTYNQVLAGRRLNPTQRTQFTGAAEAYVKPTIQQYQTMVDYYNGLATQQGANPSNVTGGYVPTNQVGTKQSTQIGRFTVEVE